MISLFKNWKTIFTLFWILASFHGVFYSIPHRLPHTLTPPLHSNIFGYDAFGRDLFLLVLKSTGMSLSFSILSVFSAFFLSLTLTFTILLAPTPVRVLFRNTLDFLLSFPGLLIALGWAAIRGPGWITLWGSLLIGILPHFVRLLTTRGQELLLEDFVQASRGLGSGSWNLFRRHLFPHLFVLIKIKTPNLIAGAILSEAALSYLGVGAPIGSDTLGALLAQGKDYLLEAPHILIVGGIPLILLTLSLQSFSSSKRN